MYNVNFCIKRSNPLPTGCWVNLFYREQEYFLYRPADYQVIVATKGWLEIPDEIRCSMSDDMRREAARGFTDNADHHTNSLLENYKWEIFMCANSKTLLEIVGMVRNAIVLPTNILINRTYALPAVLDATIEESGDYFLTSDADHHPVWVTRFSRGAYCTIAHASGSRIISPKTEAPHSINHALLKRCGYSDDSREWYINYYVIRREMKVLDLNTSTIGFDLKVLPIIENDTYNENYPITITELKAYVCDGVVPDHDTPASVEESHDEPLSFISANYAEHSIYEGKHSYHHSHNLDLFKNTYKGEDTSDYRVGIELEVECTSEENYYDVTEGFKSNVMLMERDGSLGDYGIEFISIPLMPSDARSEVFWRPLVGVLKPRAESWNKSTTGLHVHVGREAFGLTDEERDETLFKLVYLYYGCDLKESRRNIKVFGRDKIYDDENPSLGLVKASATLGGEVFKSPEIKTKVKEDAKALGFSRYVDINITNCATIEFRKGKGSINERRIAGVVDWCLMMVDYARTTPLEEISRDGFIDYSYNNAQAGTKTLF